MSKNRYFFGKKTLITGAGSGIGRATALELAQGGAHLILTDINRDSVEQTALKARALGVEVETHVVDVSDYDDMKALADKVNRAHGALDILVNNAGVGIGGDFLSTPVEDWHWVLGINLMGVVHGCKLFLPAMVTRKGGHVVNVASAAGYYAAPDMTAYSASKHAVMGLTEALRAEMAVNDIGVSAICPGIINTNIVATGRMHGSTGKNQQKLVSFYKRRNYGPEHVARAIADAIRHNKAVVPVSPEAWAMYEAKRFTPGIMDWMGRSPVMRKLRP